MIRHEVDSENCVERATQGSVRLGVVDNQEAMGENGSLDDDVELKSADRREGGASNRHESRNVSDGPPGSFFDGPVTCDQVECCCADEAHACPGIEEDI